jgi:hypothetical protein
MNPDARAHFHRQAEWCEQLGSPLTARICRVLGERLDESTAFGSRLLNWPGQPDADALALRACGALNFQARRGLAALAPLYPPKALPSESEYWDGARIAIREHDAGLTRFLDRAPQTNEVARSSALLPGYLRIAQRTVLPLSIREIGASAGLNLGFDRYRYDYGGFRWGQADSRVNIACHWRGEAAPFNGSVDVRERRGCDIHPIDARDHEARGRMLAYIWPDQLERLARAEAALDIAAREGPRVEAIDAARFAQRELSAGAPGSALVLAHTVFWQYLPSETKAELRATIATAAERATEANPFAWLRLEAEAESKARGGAILRLSLWPHGPVDEELAAASFHGQWIEWTAA